MYAFLIGKLLEPDELFAKALIVSSCTVVWAHEAMHTYVSVHGLRPQTLVLSITSIANVRSEVKITTAWVHGRLGVPTCTCPCIMASTCTLQLLSITYTVSFVYHRYCLANTIKCKEIMKSVYATNI